MVRKLNDKINLNKKIDINLVFKKDINRVTKKYLLNKYELENHILIKSKLKKLQVLYFEITNYFR